MSIKTCKYCGIPVDDSSEESCYKNPQKKTTRNWEILSFRNITTHEIEPPVWLPSDSLIKKTSEIHSVKRLSDNETFTAGNAVENGLTIERFEVDMEGDIQVYCCGVANSCSIEHIRKNSTEPII